MIIIEMVEVATQIFVFLVAPYHLRSQKQKSHIKYLIVSKLFDEV